MWVCVAVALVVLARAEGEGTLSLAPARIPEPAGALWVRWSGPVAAGDFVGLSCGPKASPTDWLSVRNVTAGGSAVLFEDLVSLRCTYLAEYVSGGAVLATGEAEMARPPNYPR